MAEKENTPVGDETKKGEDINKTETSKTEGSGVPETEVNAEEEAAEIAKAEAEAQAIEDAKEAEDAKKKAPRKKKAKVAKGQKEWDEIKKELKESNERVWDLLASIKESGEKIEGFGILKKTAFHMKKMSVMLGERPERVVRVSGKSKEVFEQGGDRKIDNKPPKTNALSKFAPKRKPEAKVKANNSIFSRKGGDLSNKK